MHSEPPPANSSRVSWHTHPSSHKCMVNDVCFLIQLSMECNREELLLTADGEPSEKVSHSAKKKRSREAWAAQRPRSASPGPIAEAFSHQACPSDLAHGLPGIFWSLQSSRRPTSRSVSP